MIDVQYIDRPLWWSNVMMMNLVCGALNSAVISARTNSQSSYCPVSPFSRMVRHSRPNIDDEYACPHVAEESNTEPLSPLNAPQISLLQDCTNGAIGEMQFDRKRGRLQSLSVTGNAVSCKHVVFPCPSKWLPKICPCSRSWYTIAGLVETLNTNDTNALWRWPFYLSQRTAALISYISADGVDLYFYIRLSLSCAFPFSQPLC